MKTEFTVKGFHCKSCEALVKDVAEDFSDITSCMVDVASGKVVIEHAEGFDVGKLKKEIEELGDYKVIS
ncbi:TPA: heavy-metal-associated domain-containing protein [Candidatus Woesearchaeota archaeon]|jgi:copper chaperone CopZ|nr:heavy metal transporter [archaeon]HIJ11578.1 heavy-metal-associated domain-containing protein [Candidatus Woesearchaeota archaeon]|tara:strand:- start:653 stop:859 length:207 start_codon:yes stop_codon:yes gene_type:complete